jgi:hypothetical protein
MNKKQQLYTKVRKNIQQLTRTSNNAYATQKMIPRVNVPKDLSKVKDKKELKHYKAILAQRKYTAKKHCNHIGEVQINPNIDAVKIICKLCGTLLGKC